MRKMNCAYPLLIACVSFGLTSCSGGGADSATTVASGAPSEASPSFSSPSLVATVGTEDGAQPISFIKPMQGWQYLETQMEQDPLRRIWSNRHSTEFSVLPFQGELGTSVIYKERLHYHSNLPVSTGDVRDELDTVTVYATDGSVSGTVPVWFLDSGFLGSTYPNRYSSPRRYDEQYREFTSLELLPAADFLGYHLGIDSAARTKGLLLADESAVSPSLILGNWFDFYSVTPFVTHKGEYYYFVHVGGTDYGTWVGFLRVCDKGNLLEYRGCTSVFQDDWAPIKPMAVIGGRAVVLGYEIVTSIKDEREQNYTRRGWGIFSENLETSSLEALYLFDLRGYPHEDLITPAMEALFDGSNFSVSDDVLYFAISSDESGQERSKLYRSDGTEAGTTLVADIGYTVNRLLAAGDEVYCVVQAANGEALVYVAGLTGDAELLEEFPVFSKSDTVVSDGSLIFPRSTQQYGNELWFIHGPSRSSDIVYDLVEGSQGSNPAVLTKQGNDLYFTTGKSGELWQMRLQ